VFCSRFTGGYTLTASPNSIWSSQMIVPARSVNR
jgi:hypothetical protein